MKGVPLNTGCTTIARKLPPKIFNLRFSVLILCTGVLFSSCGLMDYVTNTTYSRSVKKAPFDAIIVPGVPFDSVNANRIFRARMFWAKKLYEQGIARNIIFSGAAVNTPYKEGLAMKIIADSLGIPSNHTFVEIRAEHSTQNVEYGLLLADSLGFKSVAIATDPFQAVYFRHHLKQKGLNIPVLPFEPEGMITLNKPLPPVNCQDAYVQDFIPLKEREERAAQNEHINLALP